MKHRLSSVVVLSLAITFASTLSRAQSARPESSQNVSDTATATCWPRLTFVVTGQIGRDGAWHPARVPPAASSRTLRAVGGGPCAPLDPSLPASATIASTAPPTTNATTRSTATSVRTTHGGGPVVLPPPPKIVLSPRRFSPRVVRFMLGAGGGTGMNLAGNSAQDLGGVWYAAAGAEFARIATLEGRYQGSATPVPASIDSNRSYGLLANGGSLILRLAIPVPYIMPYANIGVGYLWFSPYGEGATNAQAVTSQGYLQVPVGGGIEFRVLPWMGLDLEFMYQFLVDTRWTLDRASHPWGDAWNTTAAMRFYL